jgi:SAM-dependent methyltransferase
MNIYLENFISKKFKKTGKALDLGAGKFHDIAYLEYLGWKCEGVDKTTGTDLEKPYKSKKAPFDLVYSNYVLQKIKNKKVFLETAYNNLKKDGWLFIHTFDKADKNTRFGLDKKEIGGILRSQGFVDVEVEVFSFYDNDLGHKHWHRILQITARKV